MSRQPSKQRRKLVRDSFDAEALRRICTADSLSFGDFGTRYDLNPGRDGHPRFFYYKDNGSNVLGIAHLDSCHTGKCAITTTAAGPLVVCPSLDDRLGAYVILDLLPKLGVTVDWLLTTDEEMGMSTAEYFEPEKAYDWMFSFDRGGTDVVLYQYETPELVDLVEASGARVGIGSFSDISVLDHLGCAGMNWGVGYQDYHGPRSHAWLDDTFRMVARFVKFYIANVGTFLAYEEAQDWRKLWLDVDDDDWVKAEELVPTPERALRCRDCDGLTTSDGWCLTCSTWNLDETA